MICTPDCTTSSSSLMQSAHSLFLPQLNASGTPRNHHHSFPSTPPPLAIVHSHPPSQDYSTSSLASSSSSVYSYPCTESSSPPRINDFFSDPRFNRWINERPIRRKASSKFVEENASDIRRRYISELRAATVGEFGSEILGYIDGTQSRAPFRDEEENPDTSVINIVLSLRSQIDDAETAEELQRRRDRHRNFSVFIPAPATPCKMSTAHTDGQWSGRSSSITLSPRTDYMLTTTTPSFHTDAHQNHLSTLSTEWSDVFSIPPTDSPPRSPKRLPSSPLDPGCNWRSSYTSWRRDSPPLVRYSAPTVKRPPAETFAQMAVVQRADAKEQATPNKLFRSRTLSVKKTLIAGDKENHMPILDECVEERNEQNMEGMANCKQLLKGRIEPGREPSVEGDRLHDSGFSEKMKAKMHTSVFDRAKTIKWGTMKRLH